MSTIANTRRVTNTSLSAEVQRLVSSAAITPGTPKGKQYKFEILKLEDFIVPACQRQLLTKKVAQMAANFDWRYYTSTQGVRLTSGPNKGQIYLADTLQRTAALGVLIENKIVPNQIPTLVYEADTVNDIAEIFVEINRKRTSLDDFWMHHALSGLGKSPYTEIDNCLHKYKRQLVKTQNDAKSLGATTIYGTKRLWDSWSMGATHQHGEAFKWALSIIHKCWPTSYWKGDMVLQLSRTYNYINHFHGNLWNDQDIINYLTQHSSGNCEGAFKVLSNNAKLKYAIGPHDSVYETWWMCKDFMQHCKGINSQPPPF